MLSFGIRFGQGFDRSTVLKMMELIPSDYDYDFLVVGSSPGGVASARMAKLAGKKVAIIKIKKYSPAEAEGYNEDLNKMAEALEIPTKLGSSSTKITWNKPITSVKSSIVSFKKSNIDSSITSSLGKKTASHKFSGKMRKVRLSRLDLNNELFKRGQQCRKLMHNALLLGDLAETAQKCGWRIVTATKPPSINWQKLTEEIMDYSMKENWTLQTALKVESVDIIEGLPILQDDHTVTVYRDNGSENKYTSDIICLAMPSECVLPDDVIGAAEFGITCDDFIRMDKEPQKTLIVGGTPEALECAGILACSKFPVTVISRSTILNNYDSEMVNLILNELTSKGVKFLTNMTLTVIKKTADDKYLATFTTTARPSDNTLTTKSEKIRTKSEVFDTILFATGRKMNLEELNIKVLGLEIEPETEKIFTNINGQTTVPSIYAIGDVVAGIPENFEVSELSGKLLGERLFHNSTDVPDYSLIPVIMYTPTEYAYVGISEDAALFRLGEDCCDIYYGDITPLDYVIPERKGNFFAKIIVFKRNDTIIGIHIFGSEAGEIIQGLAAAMKAGIKFKDFRTLVGVTGSKAQEILKFKNMKINETVNSEENVPE